MEQMYLIEIFIDKVNIFVPDENDKSSANKNLIIKVKFGPKVQFIIKEGQLARNDDTKKDDVIECDEQGRRKYSRTIRVGKSYLFPSYADTVLMILAKFPLEIEVWNDDENEVAIFVGIGTMIWDTQFFHMLKETADANKIHNPLSIKTTTTLYAECCCKQAGEISFILRLSSLGDSIITEFQQPMKDPDSFVFRTNKAPSMFQCKRIEGDDPNFCMVGSLYETTTLEDPDIVNHAQQQIEVCTALQSCGMTRQDGDPTCLHGDLDTEEPKKRKYPIDKIRMGDIIGPCGNTNCPLAHKVRNYIRTLDTYKKEADGKVAGTKDDATSKVCGACSCKDDRYHREECPETHNKPMTTCTGCGGTVHTGETCEDRQKKLYGTSCTPKGSKTQVYSVHHVPDFNKSMFGQNFVVQNAVSNYDSSPGFTRSSKSRGCGCCSLPSTSVKATFSDVSSGPDNLWSKQPMQPTRNMGTNKPIVYNVDVKNTKEKNYTNCTDIPEDKDCKCDPPKPTPPCRTFDCECITEMGNIEARKAHKPYCPSYKHKITCPVTFMNEDEEMKIVEDEDETEALPYGLPPIRLGPCPIMGRPCTVPDGFARMYKNAVLPTLPPSYSDAGKVCCSKEYHRIKKALKEYMKNEKDNDFRCINKFNVDTEKRCCDKEQRLFSLMGKSCCGAHKMAIQDKFKEDNK